MESKTKPASVDEYIDRLATGEKKYLSQLRKVIKGAAPEAEEILTYSTPGYKLNGMLVGFAAAKTHCGFYVMSEQVIKDHTEDLKGYDTAKTSVRFPIDKPVPAELVKKLVKARVKENMSVKGRKSRTLNPIIQQKFTADPTVIVHDDTVYLYTGRDEAMNNLAHYVMREWLCFSSRDLIRWVEHPTPLKPTDFVWAEKDAYASKVIKRNGVFYWYVAVTEKASGRKAIGVATSQKPEGPFTDARGEPLISAWHATEGENFDPSVIIDSDGEAYIFWGKKICYYTRLEDNLIQLGGEIKKIDLPFFEEGIHIHQRNGWYYLMYGYNFPEKVAYAMSRSVHGPWEFKGVINHQPFNCETNRPAVLDFHGMSFFFYHNGALPTVEAAGDQFVSTGCTIMKMARFNQL